jgi:hypothetical protein
MEPSLSLQITGLSVTADPVIDTLVSDGEKPIPDAVTVAPTGACVGETVIVGAAA